MGGVEAAVDGVRLGLGCNVSWPEQNGGFEERLRESMSLPARRGREAAMLPSSAELRDPTVLARARDSPPPPPN